MTCRVGYHILHAMFNGMDGLMAKAMADGRVGAAFPRGYSIVSIHARSDKSGGEKSP